MRNFFYYCKFTDPAATIPEDWDFEMDGEWEAPLVDNPICEKAPGCGTWKAPLISNPNYKGKWRAPLIKNPNYRGKWTPRKIANPDFFEDLNPYKMTPIVRLVKCGNQDEKNQEEIFVFLGFGWN